MQQENDGKLTPTQCRINPRTELRKADDIRTECHCMAIHDFKIVSQVMPASVRLQIRHSAGGGTRYSLCDLSRSARALTGGGATSGPYSGLVHSTLKLTIRHIQYAVTTTLPYRILPLTHPHLLTLSNCCQLRAMEQHFPSCTALFPKR